MLPTGVRKFSFGRIVINMFPNFAYDSTNDVDLTPLQADSLFTYQLSLPSPRYLSPLSFFAAGVTTSKTISEKMYKVLVKNGIVVPDPESVKGRKGDGRSRGEGEGDGGMTVRTEKIGRGFANQLAVISVHAQRKLVGLLFFWEEECMRWRLLDGVKREVEEIMKQGRDIGNGELEITVRAVEMKMRLKPSERAEETMNVGQGRAEVLPVYER